ncbi:MAG TPA: YceD family protein [Bacillales bacterium]|nr:YceD family protein [Bacillales bacterium]
MKWTLHQLEQLKETGLSFDETVDVSDLKERDPEIRGISSVQVVGRAMFEESKISFLLEISGQMVLPSSKTLEDVNYSFHLHTVEVFRLDSSVEEESEEEEIHDIVNETIDLLPYVKEAILVEKPIRVVGEEEEPLPSGEGWEVVSERQQKNRIDPRLKKLEELLDDKNE